MSSWDIAALVLFALCWVLYAPALKRLGRRGGYINTDMTTLRLRWMQNMAVRDLRLMDSQLLGHAINSASFFASSNLIVIAALGNVMFSQSAVRSIEELGVVAEAPSWLFRAKLALVVVVLARGFLDFIWALRQMNYTLAAIGAAPAPEGVSEATMQAYGAAVAQILNPALSAFNTGVRGYYFALAAAAWLMGPAVLAGVTVGAVILLILRQSASPSARGVRAVRTLIDTLPPPQAQSARKDDDGGRPMG